MKKTKSIIFALTVYIFLGMIILSWGKSGTDLSSNSSNNNSFIISHYINSAAKSVEVRNNDSCFGACLERFFNCICCKDTNMTETEDEVQDKYSSDLTAIAKNDPTKIIACKEINQKIEENLERLENLKAWSERECKNDLENMLNHDMYQNLATKDINGIYSEVTTNLKSYSSSINVGYTPLINDNSTEIIPIVENIKIFKSFSDSIIKAENALRNNNLQDYIEAVIDIQSSSLFDLSSTKKLDFGISPNDETKQITDALLQQPKSNVANIIEEFEKNNKNLELDPTLIENLEKLSNNSGYYNQNVEEQKNSQKLVFQNETQAQKAIIQQLQKAIIKNNVYKVNESLSLLKYSFYNNIDNISSLIERIVEASSGFNLSTKWLNERIILKLKEAGFKVETNDDGTIEISDKPTLYNEYSASQMIITDYIHTSLELQRLKAVFEKISKLEVCGLDEYKLNYNIIALSEKCKEVLSSIKNVIQKGESIGSDDFLTEEINLVKSQYKEVLNQVNKSISNSIASYLLENKLPLNSIGDFQMNLDIEIDINDALKQLSDLFQKDSISSNKNEENKSEQVDVITKKIEEVASKQADLIIRDYTENIKNTNAFRKIVLSEIEKKEFNLIKSNDPKQNLFENIDPARNACLENNATIITENKNGNPDEIHGEEIHE